MFISLTGDETECLLVIGDDQGNTTFTGMGHDFITQVGEVEDSYDVLMTDYPSFILPRGKRNVLGSGSMGSGGTSGRSNRASPEWMLDGTFNVQVIMWNPRVFPGTPEQFSVGLEVTINPNGSVSSVPYGASLGDVDISVEIGTNAAGRRVISFPFAIGGL